MDDEEFNLRALTLGLLRSASEVDQSKVAAELLGVIEPRDREAALAQALPAYVRHQVLQLRKNTAIRAEDARTAEVVTASAGRGKLRPLPTRSAKRERIAQWWRRALEEKYATATPGIVKSLGDMGRDDLLFAIQSRERYAQRTAAKALELRGLLDLLERHEVARVRDLPEAVLSAVLVQAA